MIKSIRVGRFFAAVFCLKKTQTILTFVCQIFSGSIFFHQTKLDKKNYLDVVIFKGVFILMDGTGKGGKKEKQNGREFSSYL